MSSNIKSKESKPEKVFNEWVQRLMLNADAALRQKEARMYELTMQLNQAAFDFYSSLYKYTVGDFVINNDDNVFQVLSFDPKTCLFMGRKLKKDGRWSNRDEYFDVARNQLSRRLSREEVDQLVIIQD